MSIEDNKYDSLRSKLKSLPKIKAKRGFEDRLMARIRNVEQGMLPHELHRHYDKKEKAVKLGFGWLQGIFRPAFIPALGLTVVLLIAIVVYFGYYAKNQNTASDNKEFTSAPYQKNGEFVIYVKKDTSGYPQNEIASLETADRLNEHQTGTMETKPAPQEIPTDFFAPKIEPRDELKDKVSEEQKLEMQRSVDIEPVKTEEKKGDSGKEYKKDSKIEKKAPMNTDRETKEGNNDKSGDVKDNEVKQDVNGQIMNQNETIDETLKQNDDSVQKETIKRRVSKLAKDSVKTKTPPVDSNGQKDSDKK